ncbi:MAG: hypothetical protein M3Z04_04840 [Chloroflexota bacterium]|nr:hypothetical protein [Chloroflexota bacterium]
MPRRLRSWRALFLILVALIVALVAGATHNSAAAGGVLPADVPAGALSPRRPATPNLTITEYGLPSKQPDSIAVTSSGFSYYTEYSNNRIREYQEGNEYFFVLPHANSGPQTVATDPYNGVWFTEYSGNRIGRINADQTITEFAVPTANSGPYGLSCDYDGCWFTERDGNKIGRIDRDGAITEYPIPTANSHPTGITGGVFTEEDGNRIGLLNGTTITEVALPNPGSGPHDIVYDPAYSRYWFTETTGNRIGFLSTGNVVTEYPIPTANSSPRAITRAGDSLWFTEFAGNKIGFVSGMTGSTVTEYSVPTAGSGPAGIGYDPTSNGKLWFTEYNADKLASFDLYSQMFVEYVSKTPLRSIASGSDGALWFSEPTNAKIGRITTAGQVSQFDLPGDTTAYQVGRHSSVVMPPTA